MDLDKLKLSEVIQMKGISDKQKQLIQKLAQLTGTKVDDIDSLSSIDASRLIDKLIAKKNGSVDWEVRDKKVAYGMATKLVFERFLHSNRDYRKSKRFWDEVNSFYRAYQLHQEQATKA